MMKTSSSAAIAKRYAITKANLPDKYLLANSLLKVGTPDPRLVYGHKLAAGAHKISEY